jgi:hypothetical protein
MRNVFMKEIFCHINLMLNLSMGKRERFLLGTTWIRLGGLSKGCEAVFTFEFLLILKFFRKILKS